MAANGQPLLMRSGLTGTVYVVTAYKELPNGLIEAVKKYDVTDQYNALADGPRTCPRCEGHKVDPDSRPEYYNGVADPGSFDPCGICDGAGVVDFQWLYETALKLSKLWQEAREMAAVLPPNPTKEP